MPPFWLHLLALTLPAPALAQQPVAVVPVPAVLSGRDEQPETAPVAVMVDSVLVRITPGEESLVELDIRLTALEPGWVDLAVSGGALAVESARLDGRAVALADRQGGSRWLTAELSGAHRLLVRGSVATPADSLDLPLPLASRARVNITEPGWDLTVQGGVPVVDGSVLLASSQRMQASWRPHAAPAPKPRVVTVQSATAVSFDESGLEGHSTLRYRVAHGALEAVSFEITGSPDSVEVTGPAVRDFQQRGRRVTVNLTRPMEGGFELDVSFRAPFPGDADAHPAPLVSPQGVFEHSGWLTVARADTAMLVPEPRAGLQAVPGSSLPEWATGLVPGDPVVSYALSGRSQALDYRLLAHDPVEAPPTVVDEARFQLAATAHGRVLMKARYTVRNDRNQYLRLQPPAGFEVLGVRVAGQVRQPVADDAGTGAAVYIPLEKSVESLQGLISFPVEVYLLGDEAAWDKKGARSLQTPAVDAPVAYARWEVWLPSDVEWQEISGLPKHVADWTSSEHSLDYGRAVRTEGDEDGDWDDETEYTKRVTRASDSGPRRIRYKDKADEAGQGSVAMAQVDSFDQDLAEDASLELFNQAYQAYNSNRFDQAQQLLEQSLQFDQGNASAQALLGNVQVVMGGGDQSSGDEAQARRVRELARARAVDTELEQKEVQKKAEEALRAGDLEVAERELERLEVMTRDLSRLEQSESVEQQVLLADTAKQLEETRGKLEAKKKSKLASSSRSTTSSVVTGSTGGKGYSAASEVVASSPAASPAPAADPGDAGYGFDGDGRWLADDVGLRAGPASAAQPYPDTAGGEALMEIPDRFVSLVLEEPSVEPMPEPEESEEEAYWDEEAYDYEDMAEEVYFEDLDDDYYTEPTAGHAQVASMEAYRPGARAVGAVGDAVGDAFRGIGRTFGRRKEQASRAHGETVSAQQPESPADMNGRDVAYHQRTVIDFDELLIEGAITRPQGQLILDGQHAAHLPMVDLRSDFDAEIEASVSDLGGGALDGMDDASSGWAGATPSEPIVMDFGVQAAPRGDPSTLELAPRVHTLDSALLDMSASIERTARLEEQARRTGDVEQLSGIVERNATLMALREITAQAGAELLLAEGRGDLERAEHERRKILVAQEKVARVDAEVQAIAQGEYDATGSVAMVIESDGGVFSAMSEDILGGIGGLIGAEGEQYGSGGLGSRGLGLGGGGTAEGLGGLGTKGRGSGASGYGTGGGHFGGREDTPPPPPEPSPEPSVAAPSPVVAFGPAPAKTPAVGRKDPAMAQAHGNAVRGPVTTARRQVISDAPAGTTALAAPAQTVSAAHLTINIPKAGERLAFEQLLVAENEPLTIDIRYRTRSRR